MYIYTGIGSRETPKDVLDLMIRMGHGFGGHGWILRSGGADGADSAFEQGCDKVNGPKEIYIPWKGFNGNSSALYTVSAEALAMASKIHPAWDKCSKGAKSLHARNMYQILGYDLKTPTSCVICYTVAGKGSGGTGQAIRLARHNDIPVFDIGLYYDANEQPYDMGEHVLEHCREFLQTFIIKGK